MIRAIFYDLDGVLVDACNWHYESLNRALRHHGVEPISYREHLVKYNGLPTKVKLDMLGVEESLSEKIWRKKQDFTLETIRDVGKADEYKIKLHKWTSKNGIKSVCVTNSIRETATEMLKVTGQLDYMDFIVANEDVKNNKPYPDCYLSALEKTGLDKSEVVIVEDSPKGLTAARSSGIRVIEVSDCFDVTLDMIRTEVLK